jgi:ABC-2 type transport system permease protein
VNTRHIGIIVKKEFRGLYSERTILFAILLQLFIAVFSSFLMVGLTSMYDPSSLSRYSRVEYGIGYAGADSPLKEYLDESRDFRVHEMELSTAVAALKERKLAAVVYMPDTPPDSDEPVKVTLYLLQNDLQTAVTGVKVKEVLLQYESELREIRSYRLEEQPIDLEIPASRGGEFFEFVYGLLVPLLVFLPAIIASALVIDLITEEYQLGTLETLIASPISFAEMVWGKIGACVLLVPLQAGAWLVLMVANGIEIPHIPEILMHVSALSAILILIAAVTALHYRDRTDAQFIFSTALVVVMLFILAVPANPLNIITRLAVGTAGFGHWIVLGVVLLFAGLLAGAVNAYAERVGREHHRSG